MFVGLASSGAHLRAASLAAGGHHSITILTTGDPGSIWFWGENRDAQLGTGDAIDRPFPVKISPATDFTMVSAGAEHSVALKGDGTLWVVGDNGLLSRSN